MNITELIWNGPCSILVYCVIIIIVCVVTFYFLFCAYIKCMYSCFCQS